MNHDPLNPGATPAQPPPVLLYAPPGSRLEELLAAYGPAKAAAEEAAARFKGVTDEIKAELAAAAPRARRVTLAGEPGLPRLKMAWVPRWDFRVRDFKADYPLLYVQYGSEGGRYELRAATDS